MTEQASVIFYENLIENIYQLYYDE